MILFCDMDGVLTDFITAANKAMPGWLHKKPSDQWKAIAELGTDFWASLDWMDDGKTLWAYIAKKYPNTILLTAIPRMRHARIGKISWVISNLGSKFAKRVITCFRKEKQNYAGEGRVLIDDKKRTIDEWNAAGGIGILHTDALSTIWKLEELSPD